MHPNCFQIVAFSGRDYKAADVTNNAKSICTAGHTAQSKKRGRGATVPASLILESAITANGSGGYLIASHSVHFSFSISLRPILEWARPTIKSEQCSTTWYHGLLEALFTVDGLAKPETRAFTIRARHN